MAAAVISLISRTIATLEAATHHYDVVKDDEGLPEAFHEAGRGLLLVRQALQTAESQLAGHNPDGDPQRAMKKCNTKAKMSESIFEVVAQAPETSRFEGYKAAVRQEGKGITVEVLMMGMMKDVCILAKNGAIKGMEDQVARLRHAIEKLSKMEPSVPKEGSGGDTFNHYGSGDMLNAPGGTVNKSTGTGNHFPGSSFPGSVTFGSNRSRDRSSSSD